MWVISKYGSNNTVHSILNLIFKITLTATNINAYLANLK